MGDNEDPPSENFASDIRDVFSQYFLAAEGRCIGTGGE